VLVADDQPDVVEALRLLLVSAGFALETAEGPSQALARVRRGEFDAALGDLNYTRDTTSGREGLDLLTKLLAVDATLPVVVMTAWSSVEGAVAMLLELGEGDLTLDERERIKRMIDEAEEDGR